MMLNVVCGFLVPWVFGVYLYHKNALIVLTVAPLASALSFVINAIGFGFGWWHLHPPIRIETISALPFDIGLYPVLGSWCIMLIDQYGRTIHLLLAFALGTTFLEGFGIAIGHASYGNGWNLAWTFVSYFVAYVIVCLFYRLFRSVLAAYWSNTGYDPFG